MKIVRFKKLKEGMVEFVLENGEEILAHEDLILKYELLRSKEIDANQLEKIQQENEIYRLYTVALSYIKTKMRSKKEIATYLRQKQADSKKIDQVLEILNRQGYLNENIYAEAFVHDRMVLTMDGPNKITSDLRKNEIDNQVIEQALSVFNEEIEREKIQNYIQKQLRMNKRKSSTALKQKMKSDLERLGYHALLYQSEIAKITVDDADLYQAEYQKLYQKLSKKYQGKELEWRIKQKLYQKGFRQEE